MRLEREAFLRPPYSDNLADTKKAVPPQAGKFFLH